MSSRDLAACVMEVTGSSRQVALSLLAACANDVQAAVDLFLGNVDNAQNEAVDVESLSDQANQYFVEDNLRAPIPPIREQIIGPDDDNFCLATHAGHPPRSMPRIKVCPLRDFAREGILMEESLAVREATTVLNEQQSRSTKIKQELCGPTQSSTATSSLNSSVGRLGLGYLFRPPTDITVTGTFQYIRNKATKMKRWLLVNVQSDNFNSQILNRDVWSQSEIRSLIKSNFLLWQILHDSTEGVRFSAFYNCSEAPYLCIIDPRTGEELWKTLHPNTINILEQLEFFLNEHVSDIFFQNEFSKPCSSSSIQPKREKLFVNPGTPHVRRKRTRPLDHAAELSEEEQIKMAVRNSLKEKGRSKKSKLAFDDEEESFYEVSDSDDELESSFETNKNNFQNTNKNDKLVLKAHAAFLGTSLNEITTIKIRLVNAGSEESVILKWPSDTKLRALPLYISEHFPMVKDKYKLISPFPRKVVDLDESYLKQTLKDANLHPSSTLHLHLDD